MSPLVDAFLCSWPFDPGLLLGLCLTAGVYLRGWLVLHQHDARRWHAGQPAAFLAGLAAIFLALASPIEPFSFLFLQVHMLQHLLLLMAAPALLWLGEPLSPMLRGLPASIRIYWVAPWFRAPVLRRFGQWLTHPITAGLLFVCVNWLWHVPRLYELALGSSGWHFVQHLSFLGVGLLFWYPLVQPYPSRPRWSRWLLFPYLIFADLQNTILAALLTFSDRVLYPHYAQVPRLGGLSALDDQAAAGVLMWVPGSVAFLVPLFWIATRSLFGVESKKKKQWASRTKAVGMPATGRISLPLLVNTVTEKVPATLHWDLLRVPGLGHFLRWRHARLCLQFPLLILAAVLVYDGWTGPAVAPMNVAGVLPWIHWRGLLIFGLLIGGNVFCLACPFMVPRTLARRLFAQPFAWPRWLRNKWLAILLLVVFLWAYEAFALWDSPWLTAWIVVGYFVAALVIDSCFRGAAFCKYLCPIGQFNFTLALVSPWEVKVRDAETCTSCATKDCIRGRHTDKPEAQAKDSSLCIRGRHTDKPASQAKDSSLRSRFRLARSRRPDEVNLPRGCELNLFLPRKVGNLDCTFCLDCIHACPHDNIGIVSNTPAAELWRDPLRSGVGRFGKRADLAALVIVLVFGAFANAAGMVGPVVAWQDWLRGQWGQQTSFWPISAYYLFALVVAPLLGVAGAAHVSRWWGGLSIGGLEVATRYAYALLPLGFAMWLSHYSFHLLTSYDAVIPATQRLAFDLGANFGTPDWASSCCRPAMDWLPRLEILFLDVGLLLSLYTAYRIAGDSTPDGRRVMKALTPWAVLILLLFAVGVWIVLQPMQMRGTMPMAG